ncbi:MAG: DUF2127 domain-containing protein [Actinobacteria bacterium]|nr:DUF2127 domain-containing protein [Actinomycetota bacterium]
MFHFLWRWRQRLRQPHWHAETFVCSRRGHVLPAAGVARLRPEDAGVGVDLPDGRRFARCLRCDSWREVPVPAEPSRDTLPPLADLPLPRRGEELREAIVLRIIAIDRMVHVVLFGLLFAFALSLELNIGPLHDQARAIIEALKATAANSNAASQGFIARELQRLLNVHKGALAVLAVTALAYLVLELVEAIGLWRERRWAEYLTAVATSGLIPFEILEIGRRVTVVRVGALVINIAIVVWLLYRKRLFGIAGGARSLQHEKPDPALLLAPPARPRAASMAAEGGAP